MGLQQLIFFQAMCLIKNSCGTHVNQRLITLGLQYHRLTTKLTMHGLTRQLTIFNFFVIIFLHVKYIDQCMFDLEPLEDVSDQSKI